jgi:hypothetical protein
MNEGKSMNNNTYHQRRLRRGSTPFRETEGGAFNAQIEFPFSEQQNGTTGGETEQKSRRKTSADQPATAEKKSEQKLITP